MRFVIETIFGCEIERNANLEVDRAIIEKLSEAKCYHYKSENHLLVSNHRNWLNKDRMQYFQLTSLKR